MNYSHINFVMLNATTINIKYSFIAILIFMEIANLNLIFLLNLKNNIPH